MSSINDNTNSSDITFSLELNEPLSPKLSTDLWLNFNLSEQPIGSLLKKRKEEIPTKQESETTKGSSTKVPLNTPNVDPKITRKELLPGSICSKDGASMRGVTHRQNIDLRSLRVRRSYADSDSASANDNSSSVPLTNSNNSSLTRPNENASPLLNVHRENSTSHLPINQKLNGSASDFQSQSKLSCGVPSSEIALNDEVLDCKQPLASKRAGKFVPTSTVMKTYRHSTLHFSNSKLDTDERKHVQLPEPILSPVLVHKMDSSAVRSASIPTGMSQASTKSMTPYSSVVTNPYSSGSQIGSNPMPSHASAAIPAPNNCIYINAQPYQIMRLLGEGGSSKVYEAYDAGLKLVAIKCVNLEKADKSICDSYLNEIAVLQCLQSSDRVIKLHDHEYNVAKKILYVVMERGDIDLSKLLTSNSRRGSITAEMVKFYWSEMLRAVKVIHNAGIIHSDLKPPNFLLVAGQLKLIDFGIASTIPTDATSIIKDSRVGTPSYMSPEAFKNICEDPQESLRIKIGVKSDVWSLGCILHHMVYGHTPFHHVRDPLNKLMVICNSQYPIEFPPNDDKLLLDVLGRCIVRDVQKRATIAELLIHPYLTAKTPKIVSSLESLISILSEFSPSSMNKVSEVVELLKDKKKEAK